MQVIEAKKQNDPELMNSQTNANDKPAPANYEAVRFNAMKHGILSRLVVLAHEDAGEFADLLAALIEEHQPAGMTEQHLIEELAGIIWRKRRVLLAEGASINRGLLRVAHNKDDSLIPASAPFERGPSTDEIDLPDLLVATTEEVARQQKFAELDLNATRKAAAILRKGGPNAYDKARRTLIPESRDWWDGHVEEESYPATAEGLAQFISESLHPLCYRMDYEARSQPAIKAQVLGEGLQVHRLEKLNRYETHLDRKFERTLAMLLKMKELRAGR
ncbi:MAG: hypothetical protein NTV43_16360 [Methylococcales bacterium]|nr:hypothetical protein [Methylococcales bacterium]